MIPGDIPCNEPCYNTLCHWCYGGCCLDNVPCPAQVGGEGKDED